MEQSKKRPKGLEEQIEEKKKKSLREALGIFQTKQSAYRTVFGNGNTPAARKVLDDLMQFCRGNASTFRPDSREHALLEGRREVFQRILDYQNMSAEDLLRRIHQGDS